MLFIHQIHNIDFNVTIIALNKHEKLIDINLGPVVQILINLTSSLVIEILTVLVSTVSNSQVFLLKKCE